MKPPTSRSGLTKAIRRMVEPKFHDSGYRVALDPTKGILGGSRPLRLWAPKTPIKINGFALNEVIAVTENGIMTDAHGGGCVTEGFGRFPIEDLQLLHKAVSKAVSV